MLFRKCGCLVGPENRIVQKLISVDRKKKALTTEMNFRSYFHFKWIPDRERERARASAREEEEAPELQSSLTITDEPRAPVHADRTHQSISHRAAWSHAPDDRTARRSRSREAPRHRTQSSVDHDLAPCRTSQSSVDRWWFFFLGFVHVFLGLSLPSSFPNTRKYFSENFLKYNQTYEKHFPFWKIAFSENFLFSGNAFTWTKHNLRAVGGACEWKGDPDWTRVWPWAPVLWVNLQKYHRYLVFITQKYLLKFPIF